MPLEPTRILALAATLTLLCVAPAAHADEWVVYESDAGADEELEEEELEDEELELQDLDQSPGPSKGGSKGPSRGPSRGPGCNCDVPGTGAPTGLAGLGLVCVASLLVASRYRGGRA